MVFIHVKTFAHKYHLQSRRKYNIISWPGSNLLVLNSLFFCLFQNHRVSKVTQRKSDRASIEHLRPVCDIWCNPHLGHFWECSSFYNCSHILTAMSLRRYLMSPTVLIYTSPLTIFQATEKVSYRFFGTINSPSFNTFYSWLLLTLAYLLSDIWFYAQLWHPA